MFKLRWVQPPPSGRTVRSPQPYSPETLAKAPRTEGATVTEGVCPYCAVGCAILIYTKDGRIVNIEGNPESPINEGTLCPKGADNFQLAVNPHRVTEVLYRAPYSDHWETRPLEWAVERIAHRIKASRERGYKECTEDGRPVRAVTNIGSLGGATLDNEENYLIKKLLTGGLGILSVENQARI